LLTLMQVIYLGVTWNLCWSIYRSTDFIFV